MFFFFPSFGGGGLLLVRKGMRVRMPIGLIGIMGLPYSCPDFGYTFKHFLCSIHTAFWPFLYNHSFLWDVMAAMCLIASYNTNVA